MLSCIFMEREMEDKPNESIQKRNTADNEPWKKTKLLPGTYELRELMVHVFDHGKCIYHSPKVMDIRDYCQKELETLWEETRRLVNPHGVYVDLSQKLYDMKISLLNQMSQV